MSQQGEVSPLMPQLFGRKQSSSESSRGTGKNVAVCDLQAFYKMFSSLCIKKDKKKNNNKKNTNPTLSSTKGIMRATAGKKYVYIAIIV